MGEAILMGNSSGKKNFVPKLAYTPVSSFPGHITGISKDYVYTCNLANFLRYTHDGVLHSTISSASLGIDANYGARFYSPQGIFHALNGAPLRIFDENGVLLRSANYINGTGFALKGDNYFNFDKTATTLILYKRELLESGTAIIISTTEIFTAGSSTSTIATSSKNEVVFNRQTIGSGEDYLNTIPTKIYNIKEETLNPEAYAIPIRLIISQFYN